MPLTRDTTEKTQLIQCIYFNTHTGPSNVWESVEPVCFAHSSNQMMPYADFGH